MSGEKRGFEVDLGKVADNRGPSPVVVLVMQSRLKPYLDAAELRIDASGMLAVNDENWRRVV
jgi:hypothetical protein